MFEHEAKEAEPLAYDALFNAYRRGLVDTLRGFGLSAAGLELWVPDEDLLVSLRNLLDALASAGETRCAVRFARHDRTHAAALCSMAESFGDVECIEDDAGFTLRVRNLRVRSDADALGCCEVEREESQTVVSALDDALSEVFPSVIGPGYARRLAREWRVVTRQGEVTPDEGEVSAIFTLAGVTFGWVGGVDGEVRRAGFNGPPSLVAAQLLEHLALICEGLPIEEARDHAVLRLESSLREVQPPFGGIIIPEFADPAFGFLTRLVRGVAARWPLEVPRVSTYDESPSTEWLELSDRSRKARLQAAIEGFECQRDLPRGSLQVSDVQLGFRIVVVVDAWDGRADLAATLMALERHVRAHVERRLEVFLEEVRDQNRKRRLAIAGNRPGGLV